MLVVIAIFLTWIGFKMSTMDKRIRKFEINKSFLSFPGPMRSCIIKENYIGSADREILWYRHTHRLRVTFKKGYT